MGSSPNCIYQFQLGSVQQTELINLWELQWGTAPTTVHLKIILRKHKFVTLSCKISNKSSAAAEMGDHLATKTSAEKCAPFGGRGKAEMGPHPTQCWLGRSLAPYPVASWSMQPFGHNRDGPKNWWEAVPFLGVKGAGFPSNTMRPGPRLTSIPVAS